MCGGCGIELELSRVADQLAPPCRAVSDGGAKLWCVAVCLLLSSYEPHLKKGGLAFSSFSLKSDSHAQEDSDIIKHEMFTENREMWMKSRDVGSGTNCSEFFCSSDGVTFFFAK